MSWKRLVALSGVVLAIALSGPAALAAEDPGTGSKPAGEEKPAQETKPAAEAPATHWWGDRFSLFIEANTGGASTARDIDSSIYTSAKVNSLSSLNIGEMDYGRLAIGWKLPAEKGILQLVWSGFHETGYTFEASGYQAAARLRVDGEVTNRIFGLQNPVLWWKVSVDKGNLSALQSIPIVEEDGTTISYEYDNPALNTALENQISDDLLNKAQTIDALYQREFGGRSFKGRWSAGLRYFSFRGTLPAAAWLNNADFGGVGYTDGTYVHLLPLEESATSWGPTGSLEAQYRLFRNRLSFYLQGRFAFVYQTLESDTQDFFTLVTDATAATIDPVPSRLEETRSKTSWQVTGEVGVRARIVEGLQFEAGYGQTSFQDCILVPTTLLIPKQIKEAPAGTSALYNTRDFLVDVWHAGFSYQF